MLKVVVGTVEIQVIESEGFFFVEGEKFPLKSRAVMAAYAAAGRRNAEIKARKMRQLTVSVSFEVGVFGGSRVRLAKRK